MGCVLLGDIAIGVYKDVVDLTSSTPKVQDGCSEALGK
jgi:hypothetical protein